MCFLVCQHTETESFMGINLRPYFNPAMVDEVQVWFFMVQASRTKLLSSSN